MTLSWTQCRHKIGYGFARIESWLIRWLLECGEIHEPSRSNSR